MAMAEWSEVETNPEAKKGAGGELTDSQIAFIEMVTQFCEKSEDARLALQVLLGDGREKNSEGRVVKLPLFRQERIVCAAIRTKEEGKVRLVANAQALPDLLMAAGRLNDAREILATGLRALSEPADLPMKDLDALEIVKHEVETVSTSSVREKDLGRLQTSAIRLANWKRTASIDLSSCFLTDVDLNGVTLPGVQLSGATLIGAKLREANLTGAHFDGANLTDAYLYEAKLAGTELQGATLTRTNLVGATLTRAYLRDAELSQANLFRATLTGAEISGATLTDANMPEAILIGAELRMAKLTRAVLSEAKLTGAKMYGATLAEAKLDSAILTEARLDTARLNGADLDQATLTGANVGDSNLDKARNIPETWRAADYHDSLGRENNDLRKRVQKAYEGQNHLGQ